jgi:hypothetical protein
LVFRPWTFSLGADPFFKSSIHKEKAYSLKGL